MTNPTPIESAVGDFVCKACELPGEVGERGVPVAKCTRCRRGTARRLTKIPSASSRTMASNDVQANAKTYSSGANDRG